MNVAERYRANHEQIARDYLAEWRRTGHNPFMREVDIRKFDHATSMLVSRSFVNGDAVLDAGCALSNVLSRFPRLERHAVDIVEDFLPIVRQRGIDAVCADLELLPYPDGTFAGVLCLDVLEHVLDLDAVVRELVRVTRSGGLLIVRVPDSEDLTPYLEYADYEFVHLRRFDEPGLRLMFGKVYGCTVEEVLRVTSAPSESATPVTELHVVARKP